MEAPKDCSHESAIDCLKGNSVSGNYITAGPYMGTDISPKTPRISYNANSNVIDRLRGSYSSGLKSSYMPNALHSSKDSYKPGNMYLNKIDPIDMLKQYSLN